MIKIRMSRVGCWERKYLWLSGFRDVLKEKDVLPDAKEFKIWTIPKYTNPL
jgi:hypothetical protein